MESLDYTDDKFVSVEGKDLWKFKFFTDTGFLIKPGTLEYFHVDSRAEFEEEDKKRIYVKSSSILGSTDLFFLKWNQGMFGTLVFRFLGAKLSDNYSSESFVLKDREKPDFKVRMVIFEKVRIFPRGRTSLQE